MKNKKGVFGVLLGSGVLLYLWKRDRISDLVRKFNKEAVELKKEIESEEKKHRKKKPVEKVSRFSVDMLKHAFHITAVVSAIGFLLSWIPKIKKRREAKVPKTKNKKDRREEGFQPPADFGRFD